jgi:hypothetical protein
MPLTLTLNEGHDFYVGDTQVEVATIFPDGEAVVVTPGVKDAPSGFTLNRHRWTDLFEGCRMRISESWKPKNLSRVRIQIDAPDFTVIRGGLYRKAKEAQ